MSSNKELMATIDEKLNKLDDKDLEKVTGGIYEVLDSNGTLIGYADTLEEAMASGELLLWLKWLHVYFPGHSSLLRTKSIII